MEIKIDPGKRGMGKTALVVDDNPAIRRAISSAFLSSGFKACVVAEDGRQGVEAAKQIRPDVITLDLSMPVMNGLEAASEMRKIFPHVPIILFTLFGDNLSKTDASKAGVTVVLLKTMPLSTLIDKANELMDS